MGVQEVARPYTQAFWQPLSKMLHNKEGLRMGNSQAALMAALNESSTIYARDIRCIRIRAFEID